MQVAKLERSCTKGQVAEPGFKRPLSVREIMRHCGNSHFAASAILQAKRVVGCRRLSAYGENLCT